MNPEIPLKVTWPADLHVGAATEWSAGDVKMFKRKERLIKAVIAEGIETQVWVNENAKIECRTPGTIPQEYLNRIEDSVKSVWDYLEYMDAMRYCNLSGDPIAE